MLDAIDELIGHVYRNVNAVCVEPYILVIDMSWSRLTREMKERISRSIRQMMGLFERRVKKNISEIYIVHPSDYSRSLLKLLKAFTSVKLAKKIKEVHSWEALKEVIEEANIALPETSKDYITKAYRVLKVNAKGKQQNRMIKYTLNSLLNVDPRSKKVQNEKMFSAIEQVITSQKSLEIQFKFSDNASAGSLTVKDDKSSSVDKVFRRYYCATLDDKWSIIEDIFRNVFVNSDLLKEPPQEFIVTTNSGVRLFKLTVDSILVLDVKTFSIKNEISFAGIEDVLFEEAANILWLKLRAEPRPQKLGCHKCPGLQLFQTLRFHFDRYNKGSEEDYVQKNEEDDEQMLGRSISLKVVGDAH